MSERYLITSDNMGDLPDEYISRHALPLVYLSYSVAGKGGGGDGGAMDPKEFYQMMRQGETTKTVQVNPEQARALWEPLLQQGYDILHIAFSSALSGTCASMNMAAEELREQFPDRRVVVVDTLAASLGEGLLTYQAIEMKAQGKSMDQVLAWLEENKLHLCHFFTVDDLDFLFRGGRVSKTAAVMGTMLGIKPVMHMDDTGKLVPIAKVRGRRQSLDKLVEYMAQRVGDYKNDAVFISHGDCEQDAQYVAQLVEKRFGITHFIINYVGPTIGAHSGPGTVALFFIGTKR